MQEKFTWVFENFSSLRRGEYRCSPTFTAGGCNWLLCADLWTDPRKLMMNDRSYVEFSVKLYLATGYLPQKGEEKHRITLVNVNPEHNKVIGERCFMDGKQISSFEDFLSLDKLRNKSEGFLVDDKLVIVVEVDVPTANVVPLEPVKMNSKEASVKGDSPNCHQVAQETDNNAASQEKLDNDDDASEDGMDDDDDYDVVSSEESSDDDYDDDASDDYDTMHVNGFEVLSSKVESVNHIFKRHPDITVGFRPKNLLIRSVYMNELLDLTEMMCQPPEKISEDDLSYANDTLNDLNYAGFKLDWLETKLDEISKKKKMEQGSRARLQTMEEQMQKLKEMFLDLESQLQKEKVEALAARAPLSFDDVVC